MLSKKLVYNTLLLFILFASVNVQAQDPSLRPVNLGFSGTLDATPPGPGLYYGNYLHYFDGNSLRGPNGKKVENVHLDAVTWMHQFIFLSKWKALGGNVGFSALMPLVYLNVDGQIGTEAMNSTLLTDSNKPFGDLTLATSVHWLNRKLFSKPFSHRIEMTILLPLGNYNKEISINPGTPYISIQPFYAFTYFLTKRFSISQRHHYTFNLKNRDNEQKTGAFYHGIYSFEYRLKGKFWTAIHSYYLNQASPDKLNGASYGFETKERVFAIGPAFNFITKSGIMFGAKYLFETYSEKRIKGNRASVKMICPIKIFKKDKA